MYASADVYGYEYMYRYGDVYAYGHAYAYANVHGKMHMRMCGGTLRYSIIVHVHVGGTCTG